ncbi:hypothetical protein OT109_01880 [Phycisphaeraceae bacterium D3-23]
MKMRTAFAALGIVAAGLTTTAIVNQVNHSHAGPSLGYFSHDYQVPLSQRAEFHVSGDAAEGDMEGNAYLGKVIYPDGEEFVEFYSPIAVSDFDADRDDGRLISIHGGSNITSGIAGKHYLGGYADGSNTSHISDEDIAAFETDLLRVMANKNLNNYIDMGGNPTFEFTITFELPVKDDDEGPDVHGELLYFERGTGGGNSWLTMQAVDEDGNALGPAIAISPEETFRTTPEFSVYRSGQKIGGLAIDVSRLGVSEVQHLRLRRTVSTDDGHGALSRGGVDYQPDFKLMAVITHPDHLSILSALYD